jgi:hypothetical protein
MERQLELFDDIHNNMEALVGQNVKKALVDLECEDEADPLQRAEFILRDRTSRRDPQEERPAASSSRQNAATDTPSLSMKD